MEEKGSGWIVFSAVVLVVAGIMRVFDAIWALRLDGNLDNALLGEKVKNYGWLWLVVGVVLILAGIAVAQRSEVGRWVGVIAASIGALSAMVWMPYYPVWSITYVVLAFLVIYGLVVYGGRELSEG